jgi:flagellin-like protein
MKILKSKKALSPVVASIILIAVTVAVSIAVAAWMGALSFSFMGYEKLEITAIDWTPPNSIKITVNNTGTKDISIDRVEINYAKVASISPATPLSPVSPGKGVVFTITQTYVNGTAYDISVVTASGYKFTDNFVGGQDEGI